MSVTHFSGPVSSYGISPGYEVGIFYGPPSPIPNTGANVAGNLMACPVIFSRAVRVDRIGFDLTSLGSVGNAFVRMGLYDTTDDGRPGKLLVDAGQVAAGQNGVLNANTVAIDLKLPAGMYWVAMVAQDLSGTAPGRRVLTTCDVINLPQLAANSSIYAGYQMAGVSGALPMLYSGVSAVNVDKGWLRIAA